jgi:hypothetical protein
MRAFLFALFSKGVHGYGPSVHGYAIITAAVLGIIHKYQCVIDYQCGRESFGCASL